LAFHSGREADHSPAFSAEVKEWVELYLHSPIRLHGVVLRGNAGRTLHLPFYLFSINVNYFKFREILISNEQLP
jgi:hypothetical protein